MGQPKGGGYQKMDTLSGGQGGALEQLLAQMAPNLQSAAEGYKQFLPGGEGGKPIMEAAQQNFQQQTIPNLLESLGGGTKGSSGLSQALAGSAANLNTDLASQLAQMQLSASQGIGNLGSSAAQTGLGTEAFAYQQKQPSMLEQIIMSLVSNVGQAGVGLAKGYGGMLGK